MSDSRARSAFCSLVDAWIEPVLGQIKECLTDQRIPKAGDTCEHCSYVKKYIDVLKEKAPAKKKAKGADSSSEIGRAHV